MTTCGWRRGLAPGRVGGDAARLEADGDAAQHVEPEAVELDRLTGQGGVVRAVEEGGVVGGVDPLAADGDPEDRLAEAGLGIAEMDGGGHRSFQREAMQAGRPLLWPPRSSSRAQAASGLATGSLCPTSGLPRSATGR